MEFKIGTRLSEVFMALDLNLTSKEFKEKIINLFKTELKCGDSVITNEIELAFINAWYNNIDEIVMPNIKSKYEHIKTYKNQNKKLEEYKSNHGYYIYCYILNENENIIKTQLTFRKNSLSEMFSKGGSEDVLFSENNICANSRMIIVNSIDENGLKSTTMYTDMDLDGKLD